MKILKILPAMLTLILLSEVNAKTSLVPSLNQWHDETTFLSDKNFKPVIQWKEIKVEATAYCNCKYCTGSGKGITASGVKTSRGVIAAPSHIPFGTIIKLDGLGEFVVQDRGGGIKVNDGIVLIDVWMESHEEALKFGRKKIKGWIKVEQ